MKTIRIFALPSHQSVERTTGVDFVRVIQPMKHLNGYSTGKYKFKVDIYDIHDKKYSVESKDQVDWLNIAKNYDVIFLNYINNPWGFAAMGAMARKNGVKMVFDLDDSLWNLKTDNPAYNVYKPGGEALRNFTSICNEVDMMTCTNSYLKNVILNKTLKSADKVKVIPNYIDLDFYSHRSTFKDTGRIQLLHYGSTTHFNDLLTEEFAKGVDMIMKEYPNVIFRTVGAFLPKYKERWGMRFEVTYGNSDIYKWVTTKFPTFMDETDILICPLSNDVYNRCKSNIKYLETSSAKIPGVYQKIKQYEEIIKDGVNGFLASSRDDWYRAIKKLIDDKVLRQKMGEEAYKSVAKEHTIQQNIHKYADMFISVIDKNF